MKLTPSRKRAAAIVTMTITAAIALSGCAAATPGSGSSSAAAGGSASAKNYKIAFLPKNLGNPYFDASDKAGQTAIESFGGTYSQVGPSAASADGQVSYINTLTQQKVGAIAISANDVNALCDSIAQARAAGVKIVTFDSDTKPGCRDVSIVASGTEQIAEKQMDIMASEIGSSGQVAILSAAANATNQNAWNKAMIAYTKTKYPNIKIVATVYGNDDAQTSFDKTEALLSTYPSLKGIVSPTTVGIAAAAKYLDAHKSSVKLTGLGLPSQMKAYVKDGTVKEFALWNPLDYGIVAAYAAKALIDGTITGKTGDTFTAKGVSNGTTTFTVGADSTVIIGAPFVFDSSNIDKFAAIY